MSENTHDAVRAIMAAPLTRRPALINDFMAARMTLFKQISRWLCRNFGQSYENHGEDFASIVSMEAYKMLTEQLEDEAELEKVEVWEGMLRHRSRQVVRNFLDKDMAPASAMSSTFRRVRLLNQTRDEMARESGSFPTDIQIVEAHNEKMRASRVNAVKQGMIATVDDLRVYRQCADIDDHDFREAIDTDFVLHPVEGPQFMKAIVEAVALQNPKLGAAAEIWLSGLYVADGDPRMASVTEIAAQMGISTSTARAYIRRIKELAVDVARDSFGISGEDL